MLRSTRRVLAKFAVRAAMAVDDLRDWVFQGGTERRRQQPRIRLSLEPLEDRIVPSTWTDDWIASTAGDWNNPANWYAVINGEEVHQVPDANANVVFGQLGPTGNCTMSVSGGVTVNSLQINNGYNGQTLTLNTPLTVQDNGDGQSTGFQMSAGSIAQPNGNNSSLMLFV
jgi:hypothetical protein